jgi:dTDP-4-dehydrorhamnose 3,5-epimerase
MLVDKRTESDTYNRWCWSILSHTNRKSVVLPPGVGLGYMILSEEAAVLYKLSYEGEYQDAAEQFTFKWNDPELHIDWPHATPILQKRDL